MTKELNIKLCYRIKAGTFDIKFQGEIDSCMAKINQAIEDMTGK